jgi:hypothetical protein
MRKAVDRGRGLGIGRVNLLFPQRRVQTFIDLSLGGSSLVIQAVDTPGQANKGRPEVAALLVKPQLVLDLPRLAVECAELVRQVLDLRRGGYGTVADRQKRSQLGADVRELGRIGEFLSCLSCRMVILSINSPGDTSMRIGFMDGLALLRR